jgi:hypothetical protein
MNFYAKVVKGDSVKLVFNIKTRDNESVDLTDYTAAAFTVKKRLNEAADIEKALGGGVTISDAPNGTVEVVLSPADTANLENGKYFANLQFTDDSENVYTMQSFGYTYFILELLANIDE